MLAQHSSTEYEADGLHVRGQQARDVKRCDDGVEGSSGISGDESEEKNDENRHTHGVPWQSGTIIDL